MSDPMNPTVTLNADVNPYVSSLNQAAGTTQQLSDAIDRLTKKASEIRQKAAGGLQIVGAGTLTGLTSLGLVAANAERQMSTLQATAKITGGNIEYLQTSVSKMTRDLPITRGEIVQLTTALSKMGLTSESQVANFTNLFSRMGAATGENSLGLASQVIQLNRQMGNLNTASVDKFANSLTKVSASAGVSATETAQFANSIAPFARAAGMGEQALIGISAAFTKAGADGYAAANTFNQMMSDITRLSQQGSPELNKYASAIGVTMDQFKQMDPAEQFVRIVETLQKAGPDAGKILERMGYDGIRASRALQTVAGNAGELRKAMGLAGEGQGAIDAGSQAAMGGLLDQFTRLRNSTENLMINFGEPIARPMNIVVGTFTNFVGVIGAATEVLRPFLGVVGMLATALVALGTAMKLASMASTVNLAQSAIKGPIAAFRGGQQYGRTGSIDTVSDPNWLARRNLANDNPDRLNVIQRALVDAGLGIGRAQLDAFGQPDPTKRGILARAGMGASNLTYTLLDTQRQFYRDANIPGYDRKSFILKPMEDAINRRLASGTVMANGEQGSSGMWGSAARAFISSPGQFMAGARAGREMYGATAEQIKGVSERALNQEQLQRGVSTIGARTQFAALTPQQQEEVLRRTRLMERSDRTVDNFRKTINDVAEETRRKLLPGFKGLAREGDKASQAVAEVGKNFGMYGRVQAANVSSAALGTLEAGRMLTGTALRGAMALSGGPWGMAAIGAVGAKTLIDRQRAEKDQVAQEAAGFNPLGVYNENIGRASTMKTLSGVLETQRGNRSRSDRTLSEAATLTDAEFDLATRGGSKVLNPKLRGMGDDELLSFLRMNSMQLKDDPRLLSAAASDIARATGNMDRTQKILTEFAARQAPTAEDYQAASEQYGRIYGSASQGSGFWTRNFGYGKSKGLAEVMSGQVNTLDDSAARRQEFAGGDSGAAYATLEYRKLIGALPSLDGGGISSRVADVLAATPLAGIGGARPTDIGKSDPLGSDRIGRITGTNNANWVPMWDKDAKAVNASWQTFFQKLEDQYLGGKRIGASYGQLAAFATEKYGDQAGEMFSNPEKRTEIVAGYLRSDKGDIGKKGGEDLANQMFGKFAGFSDADLERLISRQMANPSPQEDSTFGLMYQGAEKFYKSEGAEVAKAFLTSKEFIEATKNEGDPNAQFIARNRMVDSALGFTQGDTTKALDFINKQIEKVPTTKQYEMGQAALAEISRRRGMEQATMSQGFGIQADPFARTRLGEAVQRYNNAQTGTGAGAELEKQGALEELQAARTSFGQYLQNIAMQQREFEVSMVRGQEDYQLSRARSQEAFYRSMSRSEEDFNLQRQYAQEDFGRSMKRMVEDMTKTIYNPYQRTDAKYTWSSEGLLMNAQDQTKDIENQTKNLKTLENLGMDKSAIEALGLADPANAQQLARLAEEMAANPKLVDAFNKAMKARAEATADLVSSGYMKVYERAVDDFERGTKRSANAFRTAQKRASQDFKITMDQMAADYKRSVTRAKQDIIRANTEIGGNLDQMLQAATDGLAANLGSAGDVLIAKLKEVRKEFPDLFPVSGGQGAGGSSGGRQYPQGNGATTIPTGNRMAYTRYGNKAVMIVADSYREGKAGDGWGYAKIAGTGDDVMVKTPAQAKPRAFGGPVKQNESYVVGEKGPEMLTGVSGHIVPSSSFQTSTAREVVQMMRVSGFASPVTYKGGGSTHIDQSTKIIGGHFTVQTQDPDEMGRKLKGKERLNALRSPKPNIGT